MIVAVVVPMTVMVVMLADAHAIRVLLAADVSHATVHRGNRGGAIHLFQPVLKSFPNQRHARVLITACGLL